MGLRGKVCHCCGIEKPLRAFGKRTDTADGMNYRCLTCNRVRSAQYHATTAAKEKRRQRELHPPKNAKSIEYTRRYNQSPKGKLKRLLYNRLVSLERAKQKVALRSDQVATITKVLQLPEKEQRKWLTSNCES